MTSMRSDSIGKTRTQPVSIKTAADYDRIDAEIGGLLKKGHERLAASALCSNY